MTQQSLSKNKAFQVLEKLATKHQKYSIDEVTARLIRAGVIEDSPEDYRDYQNFKARGLIRSYRKSKQNSGEIQHELINFTEVGEDGTKHNYWRGAGETTPEEAARHLKDLDDQIGRDQSQRERYFQFYKELHGEEVIQQLLFADPPDADDDAE